ncbi:MAG: cysteine desulfurase [Lachnospiraceae bacterium]|nr:cysteine desulfurase [Lachnospiraceae bacterium]
MGIYLDHAATTRMRDEVIEEMMPYFQTHYGNAASSYGLGVESRRALNHARTSIADTLQAKPEEIYFTSGGTEADNWAIRGITEACKEKGKHIITSKIEHPAVLQTCRFLESQGYEITYLNVDSSGSVDVKELESAIRKDTILISIMYANNEVGTIQPVQQISEIAHARGVLFHTDAVQAYGQIPVSAKRDGFDMLSASAHKFNGPKGVGFLYVRGYQKIDSFIRGGEQEVGKRAGTENVPGIVGMAKAAELAQQEMPERMQRTQRLRNLLWSRISEEIPKVTSNTSAKDILPGILNVSFGGRESAQMLGHLDRKEIYASGGSACSSQDRKPSHVLLAMGKTPEEIRGAVRFSLGYDNTEEEIELVMDVLTKMR